MKYYKVRCPLCNFAIVGNWEDMGELNITEHMLEAHTPDPVITFWEAEDEV